MHEAGMRSGPVFLHHIIITTIQKRYNHLPRDSTDIEAHCVLSSVTVDAHETLKIRLTSRWMCQRLLGHLSFVLM